MDEKRINKIGQAMIWVIIAIGLVASIVLLFLLRDKILKPSIEERVGDDPKSFIDNCVAKNVENAVDILLPQGGFIKPEHFNSYNGFNVSYLCYNAGNYHPCINEHPLLLEEINEEIKQYIAPKIDGCFEDLKKEFEKRQGEVNLGEMKLDVKIAPKRIFVNIKINLNQKMKEQSKSYNEFDSEIISPVYDLARLALEIANQEAKYCYFEYVGYMILYPKFKIGRDSLSDSTEIYTIKDKKSSKEMNIAIRSCAIPPGL